MKFTEILLIVHVADVSAQLISEQQTSPGFIQIQYYKTHIHSVSSARADSDKIRGSAISGRDATKSYNNKEINESISQTDENVKGSRRTDHTPKVFTNVSQDRYGNEVKYIQRLNSNVELDKVIFYDEVNYDREPFTNKRKQEGNYTYSTETRRDPSVTPDSETSISSSKQHQNSSTVTSNALDNESYNQTTEGTLYNNKDKETTTVEVELDNRVAFTGDSCATGLVKVKGKCVKEIK